MIDMPFPIIFRPFIPFFLDLLVVPSFILV